MARNEEKAQSMLNRFVAMKQEEKRKPKERRPYLASECRDLADADRWRAEILREIGVKVSEIQNEGLGEHRLRDLNDEINKLLRERLHWERRILELGGPNYIRNTAKMTDLDGNIVDVPNPSGRGPGYRYFGAAKRLPGVRELFDKPPELRKRRTRYDIYRRIDASYYGYRDDEDGILERLEGPAERDMRARAEADWRRMEEIRKEARKAVRSGEVATVGPAPADLLFEGVEDVVVEEEERRKAREEAEERERRKGREFVVHVPLPDEKEIERMVLERKKAELLSKYTSEVLAEEQEEAKAMLNVEWKTKLEGLQSQVNSCLSEEFLLKEHLRTLGEESSRNEVDRSHTLGHNCNSLKETESGKEEILRLENGNSRLQAQESRDRLVQEKQLLINSISDLHVRIQQLEATTMAEAKSKVNESHSGASHSYSSSITNSRGEYNPSSKQEKEMQANQLQGHDDSSGRAFESIPIHDGTSVPNDSSVPLDASRSIVLTQPPVENEIQVEEEDVAAGNVIQEPNVPLSDAPLIGAPFRFVSFVAKYVSGVDLVKEQGSKIDR